MDNRYLWRIYYADGTTFDNTQGEPWDAPATRVLIIIMRHHDPRERSYFQWMNDYYIWKNNQWFACDYGALLFYWFMDKYQHPRACMAGETIDSNEWDKVVRKAKNDKDFFE